MGFLGAKIYGQCFLRSQCSRGSHTDAGHMTFLLKCPKNTTACHHHPYQDPRFPRAVQEKLRHRSRVTAHNQTFPGLLPATHPLQKDFCSLWNRASSPPIKRVLGDVALTVGRGRAGTHCVTKGVLTCRFHQTSVVPDLALWGGLSTEKMVPTYRPHMCRLHTSTTMASVPPAPAAKPHNSVLSCMALGLVSCHPFTRDQASAHRRVSHVLDLQEGVWFSSCPPTHQERQTGSSLTFTARCPGNSSSWHRTPGLGSLAWG